MFCQALHTGQPTPRSLQTIQHEDTKTSTSVLVPPHRYPSLPTPHLCPYRGGGNRRMRSLRSSFLFPCLPPWHLLFVITILTTTCQLLLPLLQSEGPQQGLRCTSTDCCWVDSSLGCDRRCHCCMLLTRATKVSCANSVILLRCCNVSLRVGCERHVRHFAPTQESCADDCCPLGRVHVSGSIALFCPWVSGYATLSYLEPRSRRRRTTFCHIVVLYQLELCVRTTFISSREQDI